MNRAVIVKEGFPFLGAALLLALLSCLFGWKLLAWFFLGTSAYIAYFFRNPERVAPVGEGLVISAADGKVISIGPATDEMFSGQKRLRVSVFMNLFDVHINYAPVEGHVKDTKYHSGAFLNAAYDRAAEENERNGLLIETPKGTQIVLVQVAGLVARRIICYLKAGSRFLRGERIGLIRFGSRCDIYLPDGSDVTVQVGQRVRGGETILARLKEA